MVNGRFNTIIKAEAMFRGYFTAILYGIERCVVEQKITTGSTQITDIFQICCHNLSCNEAPRHYTEQRGEIKSVGLAAILWFHQCICPLS